MAGKYTGDVAAGMDGSQTSPTHDVGSRNTASAQRDLSRAAVETLRTETYMAIENSSAPELLRAGTIREMLRSRGPCITILLPPYRPGELAGSPATLLKSNVQEAARRLAERGLSKSESADLLDPLARLA